jgi:multidrug ABC transporter, permease/ATP-binding protein
LIFKFYNPESGSILIDDKDIYKYSANSLYNNLTYVPQETILLHSTIYDNIKIAKPDATNEEIYNAAKKAELHNFIESLEDKYNTIVGERGIKLSGGQRQRIALARIFLRDSKIVIFDEATSSLDNNTEFKIQQNINKYFNNQTIICIAHRLSTLKDMDNILVIEKGEIVDFGTPDYIIPKYDKKEFLVEDI